MNHPPRRPLHPQKRSARLCDPIENPEAQIQEPGALLSTTQTIYNYDDFGRQTAEMQQTEGLYLVDWSASLP